MKELGGYFSLDLNKFTNMPHGDGILVNSGRNALEYVFRSIGPINCVYIPYFTCDTVLEPLEKLSIAYKFYNINEQLELAEDIILDEGEYIVYTNYFGVKDQYVSILDKKYRDQLIVDNAQALFAPKTAKCVYSPRKFVGIPDGGIAYTNGNTCVNNLTRDISYNRCIHLLKRIDEGASSGYADFRENSKKLKNQPIKKMSNLTRCMISNVDLDRIKKIRKANFDYLHSHLKSTNLFRVSASTSFQCAMVYPYLIKEGREVKKKLIENKVYVATYWPNVLEWCDESMLERYLVDNFIPLPID